MSQRGARRNRHGPGRVRLRDRRPAAGLWSGRYEGQSPPETR